MQITQADQAIPLFSLEQDPIVGGKMLTVNRFEGLAPDQSELLVPHRKDYYLLVLARQNGGRHWVDMTPYDTKAGNFYFFSPNQLIVKEETKCIWGTAIAFEPAFLAFQESASLASLPLIRNPRNAHELILSEADRLFVEDLLTKIEAEYASPGEWQQRMLTACLTVMVTYLSRIYTTQYESNPATSEQLLLKKYQATIEENFREMHQVSEYAALLHVSAGHLSEVVKAQSGRPAIAHIHERLVLEARRMLFHTGQSFKEIAFGLGFSDASYFSRFFKRETELTPAEYRATHREMYQ